MPFDLRLKRPLRPNAAADPDDVLNVKHALGGLGFYDPDYELHEIPDAPFFAGIRRFQDRFGLEADGWMGPGGETETALNRMLAGARDPLRVDVPRAFALRGEVGNGLEDDPEDVVGAKRALAALGRYPRRLAADPTDLIDRPLTEAIRSFQADHDLRQDGWMGPGGETETALQRALARARRDADLLPSRQRFDERGQADEPEPDEPDEEEEPECPDPPSEEEIEAARQAVEEARAEVEAAQEKYDGLQAKIKEAETKVEKIRKELEAAKKILAAAERAGANLPKIEKPLPDPRFPPDFWTRLRLSPKGVFSTVATRAILESLKEQVLELGKKLAEAEAELAQAQAAAEETKAQLEAANAKLAEAEAALAELEERKREAENCLEGRR